MSRVLAIDDDPRLLTALSRALERSGYDVVVARTGADGIAAAASVAPQVIVLDLRLPDIDGIEVVRRLRTWSQVPILLLSGAGSELARIRALDAGADDFVDKPFSMEELRARLGAQLRRANAANGQVPGDAPTITAGDLRIDLAARTLEVDGRPVRLTPTQWRLLEVLATHPGELLTYRHIISSVWSERHGNESRDSLRAHLRQLRTKLGDDATRPRYIVTEPGVGYRWRADAP